MLSCSEEFYGLPLDVVFKACVILEREGKAKVNFNQPVLVITEMEKMSLFLVSFGVGVLSMRNGRKNNE